MADNRDKRVLKSSIEREQSQTCLNSAEREKIKGSTNLNVPHLRFPEFSGEWEKCKLEDCVDFLDGLRKPIKSEDRKCEMGLYPYYGASGIIDYIDEYIFDGDYILLSEDGANILDRNYRVAFLAKGKIWVNNHAHVLLPHTNIDIDFLSEALERLNYAVYNTGTTMPKLNQEVCRTIGLYIPPIKEQNKIGALLSLLNERIATQNKIIEKLQSLIKGIAYRVAGMGKPNVCLKECLECTSSTLQESEVSDLGPYPVYGANGIVGFLDSYNTPDEAIYIVKDGSGVGSVAYVKGKCSATGTLHILTAKQEYSLQFLYYILKVFNFEPYKTGMAIPHIYFKDYGNTMIFCPPYADQLRYAQMLGAIDTKLLLEKNYLISLNSQKQYLLRLMFI